MGLYFAGSAAFSIFTASKVSWPVPWSTVSTEFAYIASNVFEIGPAFGFRPPTEKSLRLLTATAGSLPARMRGREGPSAIARNADLSGAD